MSRLNVDLINGSRHYHHEQGMPPPATQEEAVIAQGKAFERHLGLKPETLKAKSKEIDPEQLKKLNEDFLHSTIALNALHEAYTSASKQTSASFKGEQYLQGSSDRLMHANREVVLSAQEIVLSGSGSGT